MNRIKQGKHGNEKKITKNLNLKNRNLIVLSAVISISESPGSILGLEGIHSLRQMNHTHDDSTVCTVSPTCVICA